MRGGAAWIALLTLGAAPPPEPPVFRSTTRLVQLNVLVLDKQGHPVGGLKRDDFSVTENGRKQTLAVFSEERKEYVAPQRRTRPPNIFTNEGTAAKQGQVTVIVLDSLNTQWNDVAYARQQVLKFLSQIQPQDRVALLSLGRQVRVLHDYTSDSTKLIQTLNQWRTRMEPGGVDTDPEPPSDTDSASLSDLVQAQVQFAQANREQMQTDRILTTVSAMEAVAQYLAGIPGRKNLIWVTGGFPIMIGAPRLRPSISYDVSQARIGPPPGAALQPPPLTRNLRTFSDEYSKLFRVLNNANVAVYPVDARGLMVDSGAQENIDILQEMAARTGGRAFYNRNDLGTAIREVQDESAISYTLGYYPDTLATNDRDRYREIKVKLDRPGQTVRFRKGYTATPPQEEDKATKQNQLTFIARNPFESTGLAIAARVDLLKPSGDLAVQLVADLHELTLEKKGELWSGSVDLLFLQHGERGVQLDGDLETVNMNLKQSTYESLLKTGVVFRKRWPRKPGADTLKLVVRDNGTGLAGSIQIALRDIQDIPVPAGPTQQK